MSPEDAFIAGRLAAILEREVGWPCGSFELVVHNGMATIILAEESEWSIDSSLVVGIEFGSSQSEQRRFRIMAEVCEGYAPHGQFYNERISCYGIGMSLGF